tara:strand:- start:749 stop:1180 length:432 start_codon:yes stop_codon:yes gene_type:complete
MDNKSIKKSYLLGTFVIKNELKKVFNLLERGFEVGKNGIFVHQTNEEDKLFITYKVKITNSEKKDFRKRIKNSLPIHKKGSCFFTINGLNKLIEKVYDLTPGNIKHSEYQIKWSDYKDKFIMIKENELHIIPLNRVFLDNEYL